jgi:predicted unusual protein kinase regulating ubiquinone biosynthesis (AarF/ABC1/UbiB family)
MILGVASTLVVAARRYDARRTVETFSARLRQETDLDTLAGELSSVVSQTVQPARVALWLASSRSTTG